VRTTGGPVREPDDLADGPEAGEVAGREVEHRDTVAVDAAVHVHHDIAAQGLGLQGAHPGCRLGLVQLHAEPTGGLDDPVECGPIVLVHAHHLSLW
jgi:hypothetical protein